MSFQQRKGGWRGTKVKGTCPSVSIEEAPYTEGLRGKEHGWGEGLSLKCPNPTFPLLDKSPYMVGSRNNTYRVKAGFPKQRGEKAGGHTRGPRGELPT